MALGGTGASATLDAFSSYFNPAAIAFCKDFALSVSRVNPYPFFPDVIGFYAGVSGRIPDRHTISLSYNSYTHNIQESLDANGSFIDQVDSKTSWHLKLVYAYRMNQMFSIGIGVGYLSYNLLDKEIRVGSETRSGLSSGMTFDLGFYAQDLFRELSFYLPDRKHEGIIGQLAEDKLPSGFSAGISVLNLGPDVAFVDDKQADPLPGVILFGLTYWPVTSNWLGLQLVTDMEKHVHDSSTFNFARFGSELRIYQLLAVRGGYVLDTFGLKNSYPTWGAGLCSKYGSINISRYSPTFLSTWHFDVQLHLEY